MKHHRIGKGQTKRLLQRPYTFTKENECYFFLRNVQYLTERSYHLFSLSSKLVL